jgi:hypothetical protein
VFDFNRGHGIAGGAGITRLLRKTSW